MNKVPEAIKYFKNRNSFELPVYDEPHFKIIRQALEEHSTRIKELNEIIDKRNEHIKALESMLDELL